MCAKRLSDIESRPIRRASTGIDELDFIYGCSFKAFADNDEWGLPDGKISLWTGDSGVGKSRVAIELAKTMARIY